MRLKFASVTALAAVLVAAAVAGPSGAVAPAQNLREFDGTVISKNREARSFRLRDDESGTVRIHVTRNTRFERINGFAGLKVGARNIEAKARKRNGRWVAVEVERSGRVDRGGDDRSGRGGDDD